MVEPIKSKESVVINKMGNGYSLRASWHNKTKDIFISGKDRELLQTVVDNLFKVRDAKRIEQNIFKSM